MERWCHRRILIFMLIAAIGALLGWLCTGIFSIHASTGILAGALLGITALWLWDLKQTARVMAWLHDEGAHAQPPASINHNGMWGALASQVVRILRVRDQTLRHEHELLQHFLAALQVAPTGVLLLDQHDHLVWGNASAARYLDLVFPRDYEQKITHLIRQPEVAAYLADAHHHATPLRIKWGHEQQETLLITVADYDASQRKLMLIQDVTEQERTDQMRRDFVANVSHEMRTPLTVLVGFIETMQHLPLDDLERTSYLALMAEQATRMDHLITDLLTLAKLEGSPAPDVQNWVNVTDLMRQVQHAAQQLSQGNHALIFTNNQTHSSQIGGNETELLSALTNLVANAIRYTPAQSQITVSWHVFAHGGGEFTVQDNGPGIAKEHLARLSERFYRIDRSRSRQTGGTGLGLSIIKHVMQRHDGVLEVESTLGKGSVFHLKFPAARVSKS